METTNDCNPSFSPRYRGFVLHPGSIGHWGRGGGFACRPPPLINGPDDSGSASSGTNLRAVFWGVVLLSGVRGCWGFCPLWVTSLPPPAVVFCGICVFLLWGDLLCIDTRVWHILRHNYGTVGTLLTWQST
jgi:hypothetical protein